MSDRVVSLLRTWVPIFWGWLLTQLAATSWAPDPVEHALQTPQVQAAVVAAAVAGWYLLWRYLEPHIPDALTRLVLGSAQAPAYAPLSADGVPDVTSLPQPGHLFDVGDFVRTRSGSLGTVTDALGAEYVVKIDGRDVAIYASTDLEPADT